MSKDQFWHIDLLILVYLHRNSIAVVPHRDAVVLLQRGAWLGTEIRSHPYHVSQKAASMTGIEYLDGAQRPHPLERGLCRRLEGLTVRDMDFRQNTDDLPLLICKLIGMDSF